MFTEQQSKWLQRTTELFLRFGVRSITMDDVARELGISKKTLYQFVESKNELVIKAVEQHLKEEIRQNDDIINTAENALEEIFLLIQCAVRDMQVIKTNIINDLQKYHHDAWEKIKEYQSQHLLNQVRRNLNRGVQEGLYRSDFDVEIVARLHVAQSFQLFDEEWFPSKEFSRDILFHEYFRHYLHGILSDNGRAFLKTKKEKWAHPNSPTA